MFSRFLTFAAATCVAWASAVAVRADELPSPSGDVILTVIGAPEAANIGDTIQFDRETLAALGLKTIETTTIWTEGLQTFEGLPLTTLIDLMGVTEGWLSATAINDYAVEIPVEDAVEGGPIIAMTLNGEEMSVREKGPLWIIYPYDSSEDYRTEVIYSRSIWQLDRIAVVE